MQLTLRVLRGPGPVLPEPRQIDLGECNIGRGEENDWVLDDPNRHLSKRHCTLSFRGGRWLLVDHSTNGTFINRSPQPLGRGQVRNLRHGDRLRIGEYEIEIRLAEDETIYSKAGDWLSRATIGGISTDPVTQNPFRAAGLPAPDGGFRAPDPTSESTDRGAKGVQQPPPAFYSPAAEPVAALMAGAALRDAGDPGAEAMRSLGSALRVLVSGLRAAVIARAETRQSFRIKQVIPREGGGEPPEVIGNEDDLLRLLLGVSSRDGPSPSDVLMHATRDLARHEAATRAGIEAGVVALLEHLSPAHIAGGAAKELAPQAKARAWDAIAALHAATSAHPLNGIDSVFGRAYARAYEMAWAERDW